MTYDKAMIARIKAGTDMLTLCNRLGIELKKQGKGYMGHCPFHEDTTPSLSVNASRGLFHCFGCGEKGDALALVEKVKGVGFQEAVKFLADLAGVDAGAGIVFADAPRSLSAAALEAPERETEARPGEASTFTEKEKQEALSRVVAIYETNLAASPEAEEYLKKTRGITDNQVIRLFRIGYANGNLEKRVAADSRQFHLLQELGIFGEQGREVFSGCLVFPVVSEEGRVTELYARSVKDNSRIKHLYLKGPHAGVWNERAFKVYDSVILCEGIIDALSLFHHGFKNVSCLYGLNGFTDEIRAAIRGNGIRKLHFAFDNEDRAKEKAAEYAKEFPSLTSKWIRLPDGVKDVNEYFAVRGYKQEHFKELLLTSSLLALAEGLPFDTEEQLADGAVSVAFCFEEYLVEVKGIPAKGVKAPLKVGLKVRYNPTGQVQYDTVDLFSSRSRSMFVNNTAGLFGVTREDLDAHLVQILSFIEQRDRERLEAGEKGKDAEEAKVRELTEEEKKLGMKLLKNRNLAAEVVRDMTTLGYIGEDRNKLLAYLVGTSRKMDDPLAAIIVSRSSAGKSRLVDTVESLMPVEEVISITTASDQSFFYFKEGKLSHKLLCMGEHHGMENIEYHIRELLSAKEISKVVSMKNDEGQIETITLTAKGPIAYFMTSTNPDLNEENLSRCLILYIDESEAQTRKILEYQRLARTRRGYRSPGMIGGIRKKHRIAQRMLKNVVVRIPFAHLLDFPTRKIDARRDQEKFLNLITVIAFLYQFQREEKVLQIQGHDIPYIEATLDDYRLAHDLFMHGILQNTLSDLPKMARDLHKGILALRKRVSKAEGRKEKDVLFTRKMLVDHTGFSFVQVRNYIRTLEENEIIEVAGGYQNGQKKVYRLVAEDLEDINLSMIPAPEAVEERLAEAAT
jgi:DNA primase catalytic core